jgi:hypothetical protein
MKDSSKMVWCAGKAGKYSQMESITLESSLMTRPMGRECSRIWMGANMKDSGLMINSMAWARKYGTMVTRHTLGSSKMERKMERVVSCGKMVHFMKEILSMGYLKALANITSKRARRHTMENLLLERLKEKVRWNGMMVVSIMDNSEMERKKVKAHTSMRMGISTLESSRMERWTAMLYSWITRHSPKDMVNGEMERESSGWAAQRWSPEMHLPLRKPLIYDIVKHSIPWIKTMHIH